MSDEPQRGASGPSEGGSPQPLSEVLRSLELELPAEGTGVRAARRAARQAQEQAQQQTPVHGQPQPDRREIGPDLLPAADPEPVVSRPSRSWMVGFSAALLACLLIAAGLTVVAVDVLRDSRAGRTVTSADPDEPGFEGFLEPTPTMVVLQERDGILQSVAVLGLGADDLGGSVVLVPTRTFVGSGDGGTLALAADFGATPEQMRGSTEVVTGVGIQEAVVLEDANWADLVAPVEPLLIQNPDPVGDFAAGPLELAAADVGEWLAALDDDEVEMARVYRQQLFWEAWIAAVETSASPAAVPGEVESGLGRFVRGLAAGPLEVMTIPVIQRDTPGAASFEVDRDAAVDAMARAVPFPLGTAAAPRTLVRLLDGTGDQAHVPMVAPSVVAANASIVVVGNADAFDYETTQIRYHRPEHKAAAERLRDELGAGLVIEDVRPIDSFDVTIVLGTDI